MADVFVSRVLVSRGMTLKDYKLPQSESSLPTFASQQKTNRPISELGTFKKTDHNRVVVLYMSVVTMVSLGPRNGNDIVPGSQKSNTF